LAVLRSITSDLAEGISIHWVPGNHDVAPDTFRPTPEGLQRYHEAFGPNRYVSETGDVHLIVINSTSIHSPDHVPAERAANLEFMEAEFAEADRREQTPIVCSQHPWFLAPGHSAAALAMPEEPAGQLMDIASGGGLRTLLSDHIHGNDLDARGQLQQLTTTATGLTFRDAPSGFRLPEGASRNVRTQNMEIDWIGAVPTTMQSSPRMRTA